MDFMNTLLSFFWGALTWGGVVTGAIGIFKWILAGHDRDGATQANTIWIIAAGVAMAAIGTAGVSGVIPAFPTLG
jgi:hypothetical protein